MRKIFTLAAAAALAALMALAPAAVARHGHHASCTRADRNHDGIPDNWECRNHLSLRVKQARLDPDHDGLNNLQEFRDGTNPRKADTDGDGIKDGDEMRLGLNPRSADSDRDGVDDENELAGTVVSFDSGTGVLTIRPASGGDPVSGQVTADTRVECENAEEFENDDAHSSTTTAHASRDGGDDTSGGGDSVDNSGPGSANSGPGSVNSGRDDNEAENENRDNCTTADLTPGAMVHEAKLENGVFSKVELVK